MEIVATRLLAPYLGVTLQTYTAIIGTVLAGISLGAYAGGWMADRYPPRQLLGPILVIGGGLVAASLGVLRLVGDRVGGGSIGAVALSGLAFLLPAAVLSMIAPALVKMSMDSLDRAGREVGRIEALGTAGAICGTFVAGFVLVSRFRSDTILIGESVLLIVLGVALWATVGKDRAVAASKVMSVSLVAVLLGGVGAASRDRRCAYETRYFCVNIELDSERTSGRYLSLDNVMHSYVDLDDPTHLEFSYVKGIAAGVAANFPGSSPLVSLHVGGGGFTLPRYLDVTRSGSTNLVIERDPDLIALDERLLGLKQGGGLTAISGDGRVLVRDQPAGSFDLIVGDAFGGEWVPWHLTTIEFIQDVRSRMKPDGMYALNIIDSPPSRFVKAEVATVRSVFRYIAVASSPGAFAADFADNFIVYASDEPLPLAALQGELDRADVGWTALSGPELDSWVGGARVLTDAFAPVDQLLTTST
jgi:spermidine synthase